MGLNLHERKGLQPFWHRKAVRIRRQMPRKYCSSGTDDQLVPELRRLIATLAECSRTRSLSKSGKFQLLRGQCIQGRSEVCTGYPRLECALDPIDLIA